MIICPSVASGDVLRVDREVDFVDRYFGHLHIDIEDGVYLPNISFGFKMARGICSLSRSSCSLHLMVANPMDWVEAAAECRADITFLHLDHVPQPMKVVEAYRRAGIPVGLGLSSRDWGRDVSSLLSEVEDVLLLTAVIDDPLQRYDPQLEQWAVQLAADHTCRVWVDGGVSGEALHRLEKADVYAAVMGRAIFKDREAAAAKFGHNSFACGYVTNSLDKS